MVTLADIRRWNSGVLDDAFNQLGRMRDELVAQDDELAGARNPEGWTGDAALAAAAGHDRLSERLRRLVAAISAVHRAVGEASDAVIAIKHALIAAEELARAHGFTVRDNGAVDDVHPPVVPAGQIEDVKRERAAILAEVVDRLEQVLRRADDVDADLAAVLQQADSDRIDDGTGMTLAGAVVAGAALGGLSVLAPPPSGSSGDHAGWWDSLSYHERTTVLQRHPGWVGNLDGIPAGVRDTANRAVLRTQLSSVQAEITQLQSLVDEHSAGPVEARREAEAIRRLEVLHDRMDALRTVDRALTQGGGDRQLLLLDVNRERPRAAIATGDVDTADHVAVFTPGMNTAVADDMGRDMADVEQLRRVAEDEALLYGDGGSVAAVTWIGYEPPTTEAQDLLGWEHNAANEAPAEEGGRDLASFLDGINASRDTDPHLTALGHSYGSTTTGYALQEASGVDDAVFFGSPGLSTDDIGELYLPAGHAHVIEAKDDWVADLGRFGADANQVDDVVSLSAKEETLPPPDGRQLGESTGHSDYLKPGTSSQYNVGVVVAGLPERRVHAESDGFGDVLRRLW
ncbi:MAG: alpha/beta hydrolase [Pseudonocardiaceae bacterium]